MKPTNMLVEEHTKTQNTECPKSTIPLADLSTLFPPYICVPRQSYEFQEFMSEIRVKYLGSPQIY